MPVPSTTPDWAFEREHWRRGHFRVAGVDEAGRGAWAGPVTVAAVILPGTAQDYPFRDSKQLSAAQREEYAAEVRRVALAWAVEHAWPDEIDRLNILGATHAAALRAIARLAPPPQALVTDYLRLRTPLPLSAPPKADALSYSVAAASLLAPATALRRTRATAHPPTARPWNSWGSARRTAAATPRLPAC